MKQFKTEIIAIGTELLLGQIANTNAQWLSEQLAMIGMDTYYHTVVGDNNERVEGVFRQAQNRSDVIIVSGGLGPTEDDMTREAFQSMTGLEIIEDKSSIKKIEDFFARRSSQMTPNNKKQARVFSCSTVIENKLGMAPGMIVNYENKTWIFLPGVPREMKQMATDVALPYIHKASGHSMIIQSTVLRFIGIGESRLEHELQELIHTQKNPTIAPLAQTDGVVIRLTAKDSSIKKVTERLNETKAEILSKVGNFLYGIDEETIEEKVFERLKKENLRIAAAESLTGGLFTEKLISVAGASIVCPGGIVCYDPAVKRNVLQVPKQMIDTHGVVSAECALELAKNVCNVLDSEIGISFTGVAGPNDLEGKQVGTVYIAVFNKHGNHIVEKHIFQGDRAMIRQRATIKGFEIIFNYLKSMNNGKENT